MSLRLCLVGQGIAASPSPAMQNAALRAAGITGAYELFDTTAGGLPALFGAIREGAYHGCNVTIPHKARAAALCDRLEGDAAVLSVVNTVARQDGRLVGSNTDSAGFTRALAEAGLKPAPDGAAVVLGAGGAAAAVLLALARVPLAQLTVVARNTEAAAAVGSRAAAGLPFRVAAWEPEAAASALAGADLVVNTTPVGLDDLPVSLHTLRTSCTVADVRYRPRPVDLVAAALATGRRACDGTAMLLWQGMLSFTIWTGLEPPLEAARAALMDALGE